MTIDAHIKAAQAIWRRVDAESRNITPAEASQVQRHLDQADALKRQAGLGLDFGPPSDGWAQVASAIATERKGHLEVPTGSLLQKAGPIRRKDVTATDFVQGVRRDLPGLAALGRDQRFLFPHLPITPVTGELSVSDFRQTGSRTVNGAIERDLTSVSEKSTLDLAVEYVTEPLKQVAVLIDAVPNALLEASAALRVFLEQEAAFQLSKAIDAHAVHAIEFSPHPFNAEGSTLIQRIRNAIGAHRALGFDPRILAVSGHTAAELDLQLESGGYVFPVQGLGGSSPLFGETVVEIANLVDPLLIDGAALGTLALGPTKIDIDGSTGFSTNTSSIRLEASVLLVIRNAQAVYEVAVGS
jgi:hypothetical protein